MAGAIDRQGGMSFVHKLYPQVWETAFPTSRGRGRAAPGRGAADYSSGLRGDAKASGGLGDLFPPRSFRRRVRTGGRVTAAGCGFGSIYSMPQGWRGHGRRHDDSRDPHEADVSTEQPQEEEDPRFPDPHPYAGGSAHPGPATQQGPGHTVRVATPRCDAASTNTKPPTTRSPWVQGAASSTIRKASEIAAIRRTGRRLRERRVVVYVLPSEGGTRVGFVCPRGVGGAVARNRARRLLREAWRELAPRIRRNHEVVAVARPEVQGAKMQDVKADMERALSSAGLLDPGVVEP